MRNRPIPGAYKLTSQQQYLLNRVPSLHQMNGYQERSEPAEVRQARKIVERWEKEENLRRCRAEKQNEALQRKAREAVYFETPEKALAIIQQCEKRLRGCPV